MSDTREELLEENFDYDESGINTPEHKEEDINEDNINGDEYNDDSRMNKLDDDNNNDEINDDNKKKNNNKKNKKNSSSSSSKDPNNDKTKVVFITKFNSDVTLNEIKNLMGSIPGLTGVFMRSKYSAHVVYNSYDSANKAVDKFNGKPLLNSPSLLCIHSYETKVSLIY